MGRTTVTFVVVCYALMPEEEATGKKSTLLVLPKSNYGCRNQQIYKILLLSVLVLMYIFSGIIRIEKKLFCVIFIGTIITVILFLNVLISDLQRSVVTRK